MTALVPVEVHVPTFSTTTDSITAQKPIDSPLELGSMDPNCNTNIEQPNLSASQLMLKPKDPDKFMQRCGRSRKDLEFRNVKYHVVLGRGKEDKMILKEISGTFRSGQMTAIMGPSGAGKSSLMNILAGYRTKNVNGDILINGRQRNLRRFRKMSCYIMQDDHLLPHLSVEEAMMCSANLKLEEGMSAQKKNDLVADILDVLSLTEARKTRCNCLSGGQKKRLSIAQELVNNPPIMFFDEPTSGLDSASCFQCISLLLSLARGGRTIICTIHQPSAKIFEMFDKLYFLADGHCIYRGPVLSLVPYLTSQELVCPSYHNPADYFMEVACGEHGDNIPRLAQSVRSGVLDQVLTRGQISAPSTRVASQILENEDTEESHVVVANANVNGAFSSLQSPGSDASAALLKAGKCVSNESIEKANRLVNTFGHMGQRSGNESDSDDEETSSTQDLEIHTFATSLVTQFRVLFVRTFKSIIRDTTLTRLRLLSHLAVGIMIGLLYFQVGNEGTDTINNCAFVFFSMLFIMFTALMPTVLTFPLEMSVFVREHLNYWYSLKAYYLAKTLADLPFQIIYPVVYGIIVYWMTDQPAEFTRFFMFQTCCVQTALVGQSLGLVIGAATDLQVAVFLGPVTAIPILLFSGFFLNFNSIPKYLQWLSYISYIRYSFEGSLQAIYGFGRDDLICSTKDVDPARFAMPCLKRPTDILNLMSVGNAKFYVDFIVLCIFFTILRVLCYFVLCWRIKGQK